MGRGHTSPPSSRSESMPAQPGRVRARSGRASDFDEIYATLRSCSARVHTRRRGGRSGPSTTVTRTTTDVREGGRRARKPRKTGVEKIFRIRPHISPGSTDYRVMNDQQLFHTVVEHHAQTVLRVCASLLGPSPDAEDAWSETFMAALAACPFPPGTNTEAWLVRVAQRKCVDVLRSRRRVIPLAASELTALRESLGGVSMSPPEVDDELWGQVAQLTSRQQFVLAHRYIGGWSYQEIAAELQCSDAAARRCAADAIRALRRLREPPQRTGPP